MKISIVILSYNSLEETTIPLIESLYKNYDSSIEQEYIFVDNASTDGTKEYLEQLEASNKLGKVKLVLNKENLGYPAGNNQGIEISEGEIIVLLNNDTLVTSDWLNKIINAFEKDEKIGLVGPVSNSVGNVQRIFIEVDKPLDKQIEEGINWTNLCEGDYFYTDMLGFFCVAIKRDVINRIGLLDEDFGLGMFEDDDFCFRARKSGYKLLCIEDLFMYHKGSASFKKLKSDALDLFWTNREKFEKKNEIIWEPHNEIIKYCEQINEYLIQSDIDFEKKLCKVQNKLKVLSEIKHVSEQLETMKLSNWALSLKEQLESKENKESKYIETIDRLKKNREAILSISKNAFSFCENQAWEISGHVQLIQSTKCYKIGLLIKSFKINVFRTIKRLLKWAGEKTRKRYVPIINPSVLIDPLHKVINDVNRILENARQASTDLSKYDEQANNLELNYYNMEDRAKIKKNTGNADVICYSIIEWEFRWQRPQHFMSRLAEKGHRVFVMATTTTGVGEDYISDDALESLIEIRVLSDNVWWIKPCSYNSLSIYADSLSDKRDLYYLKRSINLVRKKYGIESHMAMVQLPFWAPIVSIISNSKIIYDCMDYHSGFSTNDDKMLSYEDMLINSSELVIVSSKFLDSIIGDKAKNKVLIRNACEYGYFSKPAGIAEELKGLNGPIIGYYGAISDWFDMDLFEELCNICSDFNFVLIGHTFGADISRIETYPNVKLLGEKPYNELTKYLYAFDVCLIPFKITPLITATNPVKFYEYSAAGKPTIATRIPELLEMGDLVSIADNAKDFKKEVYRLLNESNKEIRAAKLRELARRNTWDSRMEDFNIAINKYIFPLVSIVIVTYNNWSISKKCIDSVLYNTTYPNFEVLVVDNNSSDETRIELGKIKDVRLKVIFNDVNLGFAGGNNIGCKASKGNIIILLNNDTLCPEDWIDRIIKPFEEDDRIGLVGPMTNFSGNEQCVDSFPGDKMINGVIKRVAPPDFLPVDWLENFYNIRQGLRKYCERLGFFCVAIKREAYEQIGELDTNYKVGMFEDDDYCVRALNLDWKLCIAQDAFVYHFGNASFKKLSVEEYNNLWERNKNYFEKKLNVKWKIPGAESDLQVANTSMEVYKIVSEKKSKTVLIPPTLDWGYMMQRPQHIALAFAKRGYQVFYITPNYLRREYFGMRMLRPNLYVVEQGERGSSLLEGITFDILYMPWASNLEYADIFKYNKLIYDYLDEVTLLKDTCEDIELKHLKLIDKADLITASSRKLYNSIPLQNKGKTILAPNGVAIEHFSRDKSNILPMDIKDIINEGKPIVGYIGAVAKWIDYDLLYHTAKNNQCWSFVFIGPVHDEEIKNKELFNLGNVYYLGYKPYSMLPNYLRNFSVGILPFVLNDITLSVSPIKVFEYLASGCPVVATDLPECRDMLGVAVSNNIKEFSSKIKQSLLLKYDSSFINDARLTCEKHSWDKLVQKIEDRLGDNYNY